jgi:nucleoside-triphosphatase
VGKTSVLLRVVDALKARGYRVGGMISRELRDRGVRVGFEIVDVGTGVRGCLAHVNQPTGPQIGKYRVNLSDLNAVGTGSIMGAVREADVIVVDEIGPMELCSSDFKAAVAHALRSRKPTVGTIHYRAHDPLIHAIRTDENADIVEVTRDNRGLLHTAIVERMLRSVRG